MGTNRWDTLYMITLKICFSVHQIDDSQSRVMELPSPCLWTIIAHITSSFVRITQQISLGTVFMQIVSVETIFFEVKI